jgi:hypothetical protein
MQSSLLDRKDPSIILLILIRSVLWYIHEDQPRHCNMTVGQVIPVGVSFPLSHESYTSRSPWWCDTVALGVPNYGTCADKAVSFWQVDGPRTWKRVYIPFREFGFPERVILNFSVVPGVCAPGLRVANECTTACG